MRRVYTVSFPRSGFHCLTSLLLDYYSPNGIYPRKEKTHLKHAGSEFTFCEYYKGCHCRPCAENPNVIWQKDHDFDLQAPNHHGEPYIIQWRDYAEMAVSRFKQTLREDKYEDTVEDWKKFRREHTAYARKWYKKWIKTNTNPHAIIIYYDEFMDNPCSTLRRAISMFEPGRNPNKDLISQVVGYNKVYRKSPPPEQFRYWDDKDVGWCNWGRRLT